MIPFIGFYYFLLTNRHLSYKDSVANLFGLWTKCLLLAGLPCLATFIKQRGLRDPMAGFIAQNVSPQLLLLTEKRGERCAFKAVKIVQAQPWSLGLLEIWQASGWSPSSTSQRTSRRDSWSVCHWRLVAFNCSGPTTRSRGVWHCWSHQSAWAQSRTSLAQNIVRYRGNNYLTNKQPTYTKNKSTSVRRFNQEGIIFCPCQEVIMPKPRNSKKFGGFHGLTTVSRGIPFGIWSLWSTAWLSFLRARARGTTAQYKKVKMNHKATASLHGT